MSESAPRVLLIADDEPVVAAALEKLFRRRGYEVITALSGRMAMEVLGRQRVDGMLLDFRIPDLRGDVLYATAIAMQRHLVGRAVFLTGDISEMASECLAGEGCPIVLKPFDVPELERVVAEMMEQRGDEPASGDRADGGASAGGA